MINELPVAYKGLNLKQIAFLQTFCSSKDKEPDILECMNSAGYNVENRGRALKVGKRLLGRFSNHSNKSNFQKLLSYAISDIDVTRKLSTLLDCGDKKTELAALKLITELKGYDKEQEEHVGSSIYIEIVGNPDSSTENEADITTIDSHVLPLKSSS